MNGLTITIGQLGFVQFTNRKSEKKDVNKRISRQFINKISIIVYMLSSGLPISQPNKPYLTNHNCHTKLEGWFDLNGPLYSNNSILLPLYPYTHTHMYVLNILMYLLDKFSVLNV